MFESQTKIKLGSLQMSPDGVSINKYVGDFIHTEVDNFLHRNTDIADVILEKITSSEKERGHNKTGERACEEGQPAQPETARLPRTLL